MLGILLGALYDALRFVGGFWGVSFCPRVRERLRAIPLPLLKTQPRQAKRRGWLFKISVFFGDLLFVSLAGVLLILVFYQCNNGKIRFPAFFCTGMGFFLYRKTLGRLVMPLFEGISFFLETAVRYLIFFAVLPFCALFTAGRRLTLRIYRSAVAKKQKRERRRQTQEEWSKLASMDTLNTQEVRITEEEHGKRSKKAV